MANIATAEFFPNVLNARYVALETNIPYDWDDYDAWGAVYLDLQEKEIITTRYGHGSDDGVSSVSIKEAVEANIISYEAIIDILLSKLSIGMPDLVEASVLFSMEHPFGLPVTVTGGRKFKGDGYLVYGIDEPQRYGWGAYHGGKNYYPVIYDPATKTFNRINSFGYLKVNAESEAAIVSGVRKNIENTITNVLSIAHLWAYNMSYSACDTRKYYAGIERLRRLGLKGFECPAVVLEGIEIENARKAAARAALKAEKMPALLEWVANNTDKKGQDAIDLAEHIFNKRY